MTEAEELQQATRAVLKNGFRLLMTVVKIAVTFKMIFVIDLMEAAYPHEAIWLYVGMIILLAV